MGSKADGLNLSETTSNALGSTGGGQPKPIRKRGYHRALKRSEPWAISKKSWGDLLNKFSADMYAPAMSAYILTDNPFLKMQGLSSWLPSTPYKIEVEPGSYFGLDRTTVPIRFQTPPKKSLWSRLKSLFSFR